MTPAAQIATLTAANAELQEQLERERARANENERLWHAADEMVEAFQDASELCIPAEEQGGDPGGVRPHHLRKFIQLLEAQRDQAIADRDEARRERDILSKIEDQANEAITALRAQLAESEASNIAMLAAIEDGARGLRLLQGNMKKFSRGEILSELSRLREALEWAKQEEVRYARNPDVANTYREVIDRLSAAPAPPSDGEKLSECRQCAVCQKCIQCGYCSCPPAAGDEGEAGK